MNQSLEINKSPMKKVMKIVMIIFLSPIALILLAVAWFFITNPIFDKFDHDKFTTLNTQIHILYDEIKLASSSNDVWNYRTVCSPNRSGWMKTGDYNCVATIYSQKSITSLQEFNDFHAKYFPVVNSSKLLQQKTELAQFPSEFGQKFIVSSAEKNFIEPKTGVECQYWASLHQGNRNLDPSLDDSGSVINDGIGKTFITISCSETARSAWYRQVISTSSVIPD